MKDRKMYYLTMMAGILILTFLVPVIIRAASRAFINRFAPDAAQEQTEADEDRYRVMEGYAETEDDGRSPEISSSGRNSETGDKNRTGLRGIPGLRPGDAFLAGFFREKTFVS